MSEPYGPVDVQEWQADYDLTQLYLRHRLGKRPRGEDARDKMIERVIVALDADTSREAATARRILAIESTAWLDIGGGGGTRKARRPTQADFEEAIRLVDAASDDDVRRRARGGVAINAKWVWYSAKA